MEEIKFGEQPASEILENKDDATMQKEGMVQEKISSGSPLNKFKSIEELGRAYVNLEKEFTKKCQALKDLEESKGNDNAEDSLKEVDEQLSKEDKAPEYSLDGWENKVKEFFNQNPTAKKYIDDIQGVLLSDDDVSRSENSLERAFEKVKIKNFRTKEEMMSDEDFIENFVLKDEKIKDRILTEYLSQVVSNHNVPLMTNFGGGNVVITPKKKPRSLKEAGDFMMSLMTNK
ncbi:MAG: hypothetical protein KBT30_02855 [Clostridiales bacterium]|nr:hypothetical protein [Candidatus Apopatousia equi]